MLLALETLDKCIEMLNEYPLLYVHPLEEILRREKERASRKIEQNEHLPVEINPYDIYDITVDTFRNTTDEYAAIIIELSKEPEKYTAFKTLWSQRQHS